MSATRSIISSPVNVGVIYRMDISKPACVDDREASALSVMLSMNSVCFSETSYSSFCGIVVQSFRLNAPLIRVISQSWAGSTFGLVSVDHKSPGT